MSFTSWSSATSLRGGAEGGVGKRGHGISHEARSARRPRSSCLRPSPPSETGEEARPDPAPAVRAPDPQGVVRGAQGHLSPLLAGGLRPQGAGGRRGRTRHGVSFIIISWEEGRAARLEENQIQMSSASSQPPPGPLRTSVPRSLPCGADASPLPQSAAVFRAMAVLGIAVGGEPGVETHPCSPPLGGAEKERGRKRVPATKRRCFGSRKTRKPLRKRVETRYRNGRLRSGFREKRSSSPDRRALVKALTGRRSFPNGTRNGTRCTASEQR
ncbi:hypothetical protein NDU88_003543 [Pleurodeles waltl]|uniref:Uncharacterized protein n=1 Tax=Pleurodeles waltl TaxID=8319 RepID=A0AAV7SFI5_PLEWA|nr:hypothetical protein NDU88_003543 [Pleurodeles waltl]